LLFLVLAAYVLSFGRSILGLKTDGIGRPEMYQMAGLLTLSKLPNMIGFLRYFGRKRLGRSMRLIEYK
jgi:hypothetical protein